VNDRVGAIVSDELAQMLHLLSRSLLNLMGALSALMGGRTGGSQQPIRLGYNIAEELSCHDGFLQTRQDRLLKQPACY
jgi:hypothetical protein